MTPAPNIVTAVTVSGVAILVVVVSVASALYIWFVMGLIADTGTCGLWWCMLAIRTTKFHVALLTSTSFASQIRWRKNQNTANPAALIYAVDAVAVDAVVVAVDARETLICGADDERDIANQTTADGLQDRQHQHLQRDGDEKSFTDSESHLSAPAADAEHVVSFGCLGTIPPVLVGSLSPSNHYRVSLDSLLCYDNKSRIPRLTHRNRGRDLSHA